MKNKLRKITFLLTCIFTILFVWVRIYTVWMFGVRYDGWSNIIDMCLLMEDYVIVKTIGEYFVMPIICCIVSLIYVIKIGQSKRINRFVYIITAMAILVETLFYIFSNINSYLNSVPILPLLFRSGFLLAFVLLFIDCSKQLLRKMLYIVLGCSFVGTVIYMIMNYKNNLTSIMQSVEMLQGLEIIYMYLEFLILPVLGLIVSGLVLCYILFPEKYLKAANKHIICNFSS